MSLLHIESFDLIDTSTISTRYTLVGTGHTISTTVARNGNHIGMASAAVERSFRRDFLTPQTTLVVGVAFYITTLGVTFGAADIISFMDGSTRQISLSITATTGLLFLWNGSLQASASDKPVIAGAWNYLEVKMPFGNSVSASVRLNGDAITGLTAVTVDSQNSASAQCTGVKFNNISESAGSPTKYYDDIYILNTSGSVNNDFLGDVRIEARRPTAEGNYSQFDPSSGSDNSAMVDDAAPDGDSTYVSTNVLNEIDTYVVEDLATTTGNVLGVQTCMQMRSDEAAGTPKVITPVVRRSGTDDTSASAHNVSDEHATHLRVIEQDPIASAPWTIPTVNASEFGMKLTA